MEGYLEIVKVVEVKIKIVVNKIISLIYIIQMKLEMKIVPTQVWEIVNNRAGKLS